MVRSLGLALVVASLGVCFPPARSLAQDDGDSLVEDTREATGREDAQEADAISEGKAIEADDETTTDDGAVSEVELDARLVALDAYLADMQKPARRYFYSWVGIQAFLTAGQAYLATTYDKRTPERGNYFLGSAISGLSLGLLLVGSYPAIRASTKFRQMPEGTAEEKEAKALAGEKWLLGQQKSDELSTGIARHIAGALLAVGSGVYVAIEYKHAVKTAVTRTITVLLVSELQIVTRPTRSFQYAKRYGTDPAAAPLLTIAPMVDRYAQGLSLVGQF
jgi:hypothetical protein